ncbi:hypothetical protein PACTADRAFT_49107 [Pachysolen tannophilus NRRL Y-2460]|uniref:Uncharacterized protein n=1 Tax=Pachysolen tannophilus NRRL Y-2460 TaxID=669874 RepID=A0A1E4U060_PACTA|nr:hypothetical protein PACTADRAFT_49107 [Pachysolen tannophilus NRRL Y-2460]
MIRTTILAQTPLVTRVSGRVCARGLPLSATSAAVLRQKHTIVDSAKETLQNLNKKIGEVAASGIDQAQKTTNEASEKVHEATESSPAAKRMKEGTEEKLHDLNIKAGQAAAAGVDTVSKEAPKVKDTIKSTQSATDEISEHNLNAGKKHVQDNIAGYKDLKDKGIKSYSEQNRPEDLM